MQEMDQGYKREVKRVLGGTEQDVAKGGVEGASHRLGAGWVYRATHSTEHEESTAPKQASSMSMTYQARHHRRCSAQACMSARIRLEKALRSPAGPDEIVRECTKRLREQSEGLTYVSCGRPLMWSTLLRSDRKPQGRCRAQKFAYGCGGGWLKSWRGRSVDELIWQPWPGRQARS